MLGTVEELLGWGLESHLVPSAKLCSSLLHLGGLLVLAHSALGFAFQHGVGSGPFAVDAQS